MKAILYIAVLLYLFSLAESQKHVGCYYGAWAYDTANKIDVKICTHAYFAFFVPDYSGNVRSLYPGEESKFAALKSQNPSVKLFASFGGWDTATGEFGAIAANSALLDNFANKLVNLALQYNFDGIDIDWEYPADYQKQQFVTMLSVLKSKLSAKGKLLAIAAPAGYQVDIAYDVPNVCKYVDILNLMSYDMQWPHSVTGTNAGFSQANNAVSKWINMGCPASKIVLGLPAYGRVYTLKDQNINGLGAAAINQQEQAYTDICNWVRAGGYTQRIYDQTPVAIKGTQWITYEDVTSVTYKINNIVKARGLAGAFFWSTAQDDPTNSCGGGKFPLITAVYRNLMGTSGTATTLAPATTKAATTLAPTTTKASSTVFTCPSSFGFYKHPSDCTKYYQCSYWVAYLFTCGSGLGYNPACTCCDWKHNIAGCV